MKSKIYIGVLFAVGSHSKVIVETCLFRAENQTEANETVKKYALGYVEKNKVECSEIFTVAQEKDKFALQKIVNDFTSPKDLIINSIREAVNESFETIRPADCVSDKFLN